VLGFSDFNPVLILFFFHFQCINKTVHCHLESLKI